MSKQIWSIDPSHSEIQFKVKHLMITTVSGNFSDFTSEIAQEGDDFDGASISFSAGIDSISTGNEHRDAHLKSADFFDAANFEKLHFVSTSFSQNGEEFDLEGNLTIRGTQLPIKLAVEFAGIVVDPYGQTKAGFELTGKISRKAYGLTWNGLTEAGGAVVSDEVKIICAVQYVKQ